MVGCGRQLLGFFTMKPNQDASIIITERPSKMQELKHKVSEIWYAITPDEILKLYCMLDRVKELEKVRAYQILN